MLPSHLRLFIGCCLAALANVLAVFTLVSTRGVQDGFSALHRSCVTGNVEVIKFLVAHHADVNAEDSYGDSPMHYACFCGHMEAVQVLVKAGANPNKVGAWVRRE